jgi:5,10-methylene-tetrahydrofolate dehydrogenase/methenyl tetrahydrofolate cyclohydrolase
MARILDGAALAAAIKQEVAEEVDRLAAYGIRPGLAVVLVGNIVASEIYVRNKVQACADLGIYSDLAYTPVPGGVGLPTIAMLMANSVRAAQMRRKSIGGGLS